MMLSPAQIARAQEAADTAPTITAHDVVAEVARIMGVSVADIRSHGKGCHKIMRARVQAALCAREKGFSFPQIGKAVNRNHTTVMAALGMRKERARKQRDNP